jgi:hypothetical protein
MEDQEGQMGDGVRLALAIAVLFLAGIAFFFAFHPNGVTGATNPDNALEWLMSAFNTTAAGAVPETAEPTIDVATTPIAGVTPQPQPGVSV